MCTTISHYALFALAMAFALGCETPEKTTTRQWFKGNLHTHSFWSDGDEYPEMIMDWYKSQGYNFLALSDHNILADSEKWIVVPKSKMYQEGFESYLNKYDSSWVVHRRDTGRIQVKLKALAEYRPLFEDDQFLIIQSEEISDRFGDKPIHMNATNIAHLIEPQGGESVVDVMQRNVNAVLEQRKVTGIPMIPHINHPNFYFGVSQQDLIDLRGERFFEVYNGHPMVLNYGDSTHPGTEEMWDNINLAYHRRGQPLMYGLATDDSHNYHQFGSAYSNAGRGWVMVRCDSLSPSAIIQALEAGEFYSSTGVTLSDVSLSNNVLRVAVEPEPKITYTIEFIGARKDADTAIVLRKVAGPVAAFEVSENELFVRARVTSDKYQTNPFQEKDFEMAWTQPVVYTLE
jgi:hypothetical protein